VAVINVKGMGNVEFPDSMSPEEIKAALDKQFNKQPPAPGFAQNVGQDLAARAQAIKETGQGMNFIQNGQLTVPLAPVEAAVQGAGQLAGGALDVSGQAIKSLAKTGYEGLPASLRQKLEKVDFSQIGNIPIVRQGLDALAKGGEVYNSFKSQYPQIAKDIESMVNIGTIAFPAKGRPGAPETPLGKAAGKLERRAMSQEAKTRQNFVQKLVSPPESKKVLEEQALRTSEKGVLRSKTVAPSAKEAEIANEVNKIGSVTHNRSIGYNLRRVDDANTQLAKKLEADLGRRRQVLLKTDVNQSIKNNLDTLRAENPFISSDKATMRMTDEVARNADRILSKHKKTPLGVLKARREFDQWALDLRKGTFDSDTTNAFKQSVRSVRDAMNNAINEAVPDARVAKSLERQSNLFSALENMKPKAAVEGKNALVRTIKRIGNISEYRGHIVQLLGAAAGVGAIGATQMFNQPVRDVAVLGLLGWGAGRAILSPKGKRFLAGLIRLTDRSIRSTNKPSVIKQMRADRAILVDMLKNATIEKGKNNGN